MLPSLKVPYERTLFAETPAILNGSGCGSRTHYLSGYEPGMIFRFTHPQIVLVSIIHGGLFQRNNVFYWLTIIIFFSGLYAFQHSINLILYFPPTKIIKRTFKIWCWVYFIEYFVHPTNKVYHVLTPQPRSFLRDLPTLGAFWLFTLHQTVSFKQRTNKSGSVKGNRTPLTGVKVQCPSR